MRRSLLAALGTPDLRRLQVSWSVSAAGAWVFFVVLAIYAYDVGGATAVGVAALVRMLPAGLAAPFAGVLVDRHSRRDVLLSTLALRAAALAGMAAAIAGGAPAAAVFALAAVFTVATTAHKPAQAALLPALAQTPQQLAACNAVWSGIDNAAFLAGSLLGGLLVTVASVEAAFAATALLFALALVPVARIARDPVPGYRARAQGLRPWAGVLGGLRDIRADHGLRLVVGFLSVSTLVEGAVDVLVVVVALELLDLGDAGVGWLNAAWGAGGLLGGAVALALLGRGRLGGGLVTGGLLVGLPLVAIAAVREPLAIAALIGLLGVGYALIEVGGLSLLQRLSSDEVLGRAFAAVESTYWITTGLGAMLAPAAIALLGTSGALVAVGACLPVTVAFRARALRRLATVDPVPDDGFRALRSVPDFAPLPLATVENVARRLSELRLPAGTVVIREGDPGDCCYVVAEGRLDVSCDHVALRTAASGELLGEIALLRDVARTATVTACDDVVLYALQRGDFLSTVSAHPRTTEAVAATAAQRLEGSHDGDN